MKTDHMPHAFTPNLSNRGKARVTILRVYCCLGVSVLAVIIGWHLKTESCGKSLANNVCPDIAGRFNKGTIRVFGKCGLGDDAD